MGGSGSSSRPGSRPVSRPPSPSFSTSPSVASSSFNNVAALSQALDDPLSEYFADGSTAGSSRQLNSYTASTASSLLSPNASTEATPVPSMSGLPHVPDSAHSASPHTPLEIFLDSDDLMLRGQGGDMNPAYLSGYVSLWLAESTNLKDITMQLTGKAKVHFQDASK